MKAVKEMVKLAKIPIESIKENLLFDKDGYIWAYYRITAEETNPNNLEELEKYKKRWATMFRKTLPKYGEFELDMYPKDKQLAERFKEFSKDLAPEHYSLGLEYMGRTVVTLKNELGEITEPDFILGVRLKDMYSNENPIESMKRVAEDVSDQILSLLGKKVLTADDELAKIKPVEEELYRSLRSRKASRLTEDELIYLNRLNFIGGLPHEKNQEDYSKERISQAIVDAGKDVGFIHLESDVGKSVVSYLPIADFEENDIAYNHLYQIAQQMDFPCRFRIKAHYPDPKGVTGFSSKVMIQKNRHKTEAKEARQAGESISSRIKANFQATESLANELENNEPILRWLGCFVITGKSREQNKRRGDALMNAMKTLKINVVRPSAKQAQLFYRCLFGASIESMSDWMQVTNGYGLAESLFAVTNRAGTRSGWYLGRIDPFLESETLKDSIHSSRNSVFYNMLVANQGQEGAITDSPHVAITGETGKGKSYLTGLLFFYSSLLDAKVLYIDPKNQVAKQFKRTANDPVIQQKFPSFVTYLNSINYVTLDASKKENHGVLDPIVFLHGVEAKDTAQAMIQSIYNLDNREEVETAINEELDKAIEERELGEQVGLLTVIRRLFAYEDQVIKRAAKLLLSKIQNSVLQLGFSDGDSKGLDLDHKCTVLGIAGLNLPEPHVPVKDYSEANKKSTCLMLPLGKFCEKFGNQNEEQYTIEFFDEAWILAKAKGGREVLKAMQRVGRSFCNILVYSTQSVKDVGDDQDTNSFGTMFAFDWQSERSDILSHIGIEVNERNMTLVENMKKGQCLFRDIYGRTAKLSVHNLFPEWHHALQTVKKTASSQAEKQFA
ncbi:conjugal transfer family protein [Enterococcus faecalis 06-MB-DW-09]|nr:conjugal transfer family protein [Enterococcus faecalis 06-MB-DW-09]